MSDPEENITPLPGFEIRPAVVGVELVFSVDQLIKCSEYTIDPDLPVSCTLTEESKEHVKQALDRYYENNEEILEYSHSVAHFKSRVHKEHVEVLMGLLANELSFEFRHVFDNSEDVPDTRDYNDWITDSETAAPDVSWEAFSDVDVNIEKEIERNIPSGLSDAKFTQEAYLEYTYEFVSDAVQAAEWQGGHAWLINIGIHELRNGRYRAAAYAFEGAKNGLTKHRLWGKSRIDGIVDRCLNTLRELCFLQADDDYDLTSMDLSIDMKNRDLIFYPEYSSKPTLFEQNYKFTTVGWVINSLLLVQATAHSMDSPTISRTEVDPFGSNMTARNVSFVLSLCAALSDQIQEKDDRPVRQLERIYFNQYSPDITVTRTLREAGFEVRSYTGESTDLIDECDIEYDYIVERDSQSFLVRALRPADRKKSVISGLVSEIEDIDYQLMLLYEAEIDDAVVDAYANKDVSLNYIDLQNERIAPVESGFPQGYDSLSTPEEIQEKISELYEITKCAEGKQEKGDSLEKLMSVIFEHAVPDTTVQTVNNRTRVEEIDLQLRNKENRYPWKDLGAPINVECKNWTKSAGVSVIYTAYGKAKATSPDCKGIILVCWEGISDAYDGRNGDQAIREIRRDGVNIIVIDKSDLKKISETGDAQAVFEDKMDALIRR